LSVKPALAAALALACVIAAGRVDAAPPASTAPEDRLLPVELYTTDKAKTLGATHRGALRALNSTVYHCMPWVETQKHSIGFFRPKNAAGDDRYLSIRIYIEQDPSPEFARNRVDERASAMFSRYVGAMLRRMTKDPAVAADATLDGFTVILEWMKQVPRGAGERPVHETIAVFIEKSVGLDYLSGTIPITEVAAKARVLAFDGETPLGPLRLAVWDDNFVSTFKVSNYVLEPGVTCG
jgi:hypothetical protein